MMVKKTVTMLLLAAVLYLPTLHSQKIIAHRGFWKTEGSAQNSVAALMKADSIRAYGSEVDIWISSDGIPVVNHDATVTLNGKQLRVEDTPFETLRKVKLSNGEQLPTVEEYLNAFEKCTHTRLIIEFKSHKVKERETELARKVIDMVHQRGIREKVEYIAFGIHFVQLVRQFDPQAPVYYLNGDMSPAVLSSFGAAGLDYQYNVLFKRPEWVQAAHELGQKVNIWTVNKPEDIQKAIELEVDFITTDEPLLVKELLKKH
ncbi:MAG: glycerophosphodiester phosphodiesterase family protein [bacterium]|jgi:glycerophosphoryl diester phosphodiesterase|nr:glycerophosphodiester phosphodiesterase family protein [bacterium]MDD3624103.1 glycerophosphodiester phosphodiesterase family protein [Proteiniphilum sp.]MDD3967715.1 glycerophosphodiester phosphodiesterase family protein [Proteiniphilum sp.]MDD4458940.1 glycerophosphodiester phosphodiesterase family protein [Proteiniphilum sp.]